MDYNENKFYAYEDKKGNGYSPVVKIISIKIL